MRSILLVGMIVVGCAPPPKQPIPWTPVRVRADVGFTTYEKAVITTAVGYLRENAIDFTIRFDLSPEEDLTQYSENRMWRLPARADFTDALDAKYAPKGHVLGTTVSGDRGFTTWLIPERTPSTFLLMHVTEHELLHGIGCDHVPDPGSVMYYRSEAETNDSVRLSSEDLDEIRAALKRAENP